MENEVIIYRFKPEVQYGAIGRFHSQAEDGYLFDNGHGLSKLPFQADGVRELFFNQIMAQYNIRFDGMYYTHAASGFRHLDLEALAEDVEDWELLHAEYYKNTHNIFQERPEKYKH